MSTCLLQQCALLEIPTYRHSLVTVAGFPALPPAYLFFSNGTLRFATVVHFNPSFTCAHDCPTSTHLVSTTFVLILAIWTDWATIWLITLLQHPCFLTLHSHCASLPPPDITTPTPTVATSKVFASLSQTVSFTCRILILQPFFTGTADSQHIEIALFRCQLALIHKETIYTNLDGITLLHGMGRI